MLCISVPGYFHNSYTNCHYNNKGVRYSLRPRSTATTVAQAIQAVAAADPFTPGPSSAAPTGLNRLTSRPIRRIAPTNISSTPHSSSAAVRRRSHAERMREISRHHQALAELYLEEADRLDEDLSLE